MEKIKRLVELGWASPLGTGMQYMPWIHIEDLCAIYLKAMSDQSMQGPYNAVAPESINNKQFMKSLADVLKKPCYLPAVPGIIIRLLWGKRSVLLLHGSRVSAQKIQALSFAFRFPTLYEALQDLQLNVWSKKT